MVRRKATYDDLYGIPENTTGQIINGRLIVTPRPSRKHIYATSALGTEIGPPYQLGRGGPGGWVILIEPEIRLGEHTIVPDLGGWKRERFESDKVRAERFQDIGAGLRRSRRDGFHATNVRLGATRERRDRDRKKADMPPLIHYDSVRCFTAARIF